jgi:hypothetical protein
VPLSSLGLDSSAAGKARSISTATTSRTIYGIGALSGRLIHGLGEILLRGVDVMVIQRRLSYIETLSPLSDQNPQQDIERIYDDLVELSQYVIQVYVAGDPGYLNIIYKARVLL